MAHQMCCDHKKTERTVGMGVGGDREVELEGGGYATFEKKKEGRQYR